MLSTFCVWRKGWDETCEVLDLFFDCSESTDTANDEAGSRVDCGDLVDATEEQVDVFGATGQAGVFKIQHVESQCSDCDKRMDETHRVCKQLR